MIGTKLLHSLLCRISISNPVMTHASSIQLSHELRIHNTRGCSSQHSFTCYPQCVTGKEKNRVHLVNFSLSAHGLRRDAWTLHFLSSTRGPIIAAPSRCNIFLCQSLLTPNGGNGIPVLKSASVVLTRSYDALGGNQLVLKLIPAVGIIAFAAWALGPLMRLGRVIFLHKSDNTWKKSRTNYIMSSYLQPLLLWTGAMLICRALDPLILQSEASQAVKQRLLNFVQSLSTVLAFAYCLSSLIQQAQKFFTETNDSDGARNMGFSFAGKAIYSAVWIAAVSLFMELLGFSTQRWLTAGGLGTVLLTLAGREIFTNFLSSVMIHATRPFVVGEWIQTKIEGYEVSGTVEHVGWWSPTIIRGDDREAVHIPNHQFTVNVVRNLSQKTHWRIKTHLAISHLDVKKINNIVADMRKVLAKNPQVEQQRLHRRVFLDNVDPENQGLKILVSCFVKTSHIEEYLCVKEAVLLDLLRVISHHKARLATPIRTVQKMYSEADLDNVPFADTIFTRSGVATNRSLLLIEPSYKINSDDKTKDSAHSVRSEAASTSESKADSSSGSMPNVDSIKDKVTATNSDSNTTSKVSAIPVSEPQPSVGRPPLEENIVLGVALEGSKRTLPIEEEMAPSPFPPESMELTASRNGGGSPSVGKDKKDGQMPTVPSSSNID